MANRGKGSISQCSKDLNIDNEGFWCFFLIYRLCFGARFRTNLPSGWKPDGPSFFLPSEVSRSLNEPPQENTYSESEASGSDFLREYGPPEVQVVSQDISQQGLPDIENEQLFIDNVVKTNDEKEIAEVNENKEIKGVEKIIAVTESQVVSATESVTNVEEEVVQVNDETTTLASAAEPVDAIDEFGYNVETTVAIAVPTEKITVDENVKSENQILDDIIVKAEQLINEQNESEKSNEEENLAITGALQMTSESQPSISIVTKQAEYSSIESSDASVTQESNLKFDFVSGIEKKVQTVQEEIKTLEQNVQNIPDLIHSLENEISSQKDENIQVTVAVPEALGSLEEAPEGFLEYGPPGFREYGPPNEDLKDNTIEEKLPEVQSIDKSQRRRRRFSSKFRSSQKSH